MVLDRLRKAIQSEEADEAITQIRELAGGALSPGDALDLVRLLARTGDPRFDAYADRWLTRYIAEKGATFAQRQVAMTAISALAIAPDDRKIIDALRATLPPQT